MSLAGLRTLLIVGLVIAYVVFVVSSNISFKWSAGSPDWRGFLRWQVAGNLAGFMGVLSFTFLLRFVPLYLAYAVGQGLGFVSVQLIGAHLVFKETISPGQWLGMLLITAGIILISLGQQ